MIIFVMGNTGTQKKGVKSGTQDISPHPLWFCCFKPLLFLVPALSLLWCISCKPGADEVLSEAKYLSAPKQWDKKILSQLENTEAVLSTSWKKGRLYYILYVSPYNGSFDRYIKDTLADNKLAIHFEDMGGLNMLTIDVPLKKMTPVANSHGEPATLQMSGDVLCTKQMYKAVTDWSVTWSFPLKH
jgi:hypothetical protein